MMRFAAIADVHGNYLALEAVIADIRAQRIDKIVNLGDMASGPLDGRRTMDIRGKTIDALIHGADCVTLLLPLWRKAQVHARIRDED